mgnify:CR=1 FL=1
MAMCCSTDDRRHRAITPRDDLFMPGMSGANGIRFNVWAGFGGREVQGEQSVDCELMLGLAMPRWISVCDRAAGCRSIRSPAALGQLRYETIQVLMSEPAQRLFRQRWSYEPRESQFTNPAGTALQVVVTW